MAQKTSWDGAALTESDINTYLMGEGGAWTTYTPTVDQGASTNIAKTVNYSSYARYGRTIHWVFDMTLSAAGTAGSNVTVTLPVTAANSSGVRGAAAVFDTSTTIHYVTSLIGASTTTVSFRADTTGSGSWGTNPNIALATGDILRGSVTYEAAS